MFEQRRFRTSRAIAAASALDRGSWWGQSGHRQLIFQVAGMKVHEQLYAKVVPTSGRDLRARVRLNRRTATIGGHYELCSSAKVSVDSMTAVDRHT